MLVELENARAYQLIFDYLTDALVIGPPQSTWQEDYNIISTLLVIATYTNPDIAIKLEKLQNHHMSRSFIESDSTLK